MPRKKTLTFILSAIFLLLLGSSFTLMVLTIGGICKFQKLSSEFWALACSGSFIALFFTHLYYIKIERQSLKEDKEVDNHNLEEINLESSNLRNDFERFKRNNLHVIKTHLRISILFWIQLAKREQTKSFEEVRKEIFRELKKEISGVTWMDEMMEELKQEVAKYKNGLDFFQKGSNGSGNEGPEGKS